MWREESLKINNGGSETLSSYTKDSTLYFCKKISYIYIFTEQLLKTEITFVHECFIEHLRCQHTIWGKQGCSNKSWFCSKIPILQLLKQVWPSRALKKKSKWADTAYSLRHYLNIMRSTCCNSVLDSGHVDLCLFLWQT